MTVRLLSVQVVKFWELIKFALSQVERLGIDETLDSLNRLFASLLCDKSQCFIVYDDDKNVIALAITEIIEKVLTKEKSLRIRCLYAFKPVDKDVWISEFESIRDMAKQSGCSKIVCETSNARIEYLASRVGAIKTSVNLEIPVEV